MIKDATRMNKMLTFEDLSIGDQWVSPPREIRSEDVQAFADLTGDHHPLHTDRDFASQSPFGRPIAHGLLGLSLVAGLSSQFPWIDTVAFVGVHDWKFLRPVYHGDRVRVVSRVDRLESYGRRRGRLFLEKTLVNQRGEAVQRGVFETIVARYVNGQRRSCQASTSAQSVVRSAATPAK